MLVGSAVKYYSKCHSEWVCSFFSLKGKSLNIALYNLANKETKRELNIDV